MRTADGVPLKVSLHKALVRSRIRALLLVLPLLGFLLVAFLLPIGYMLFRSVDNRIVPSIFPAHGRFDPGLEPRGQTWLPGEAVFEALVGDIQKAFKDRTLGRVGRRLNYEKSGMSSLFRKSGKTGGPASPDRPTAIRC